MLFAVVLCVIFTVTGIKKIENDVSYEKVIVAEGDTLWSYSVQYANDVPVEKWIQEIVKVNNLSSTNIRVGEEIRIPWKSKRESIDISTHIAGDGE